MLQMIAFARGVRVHFRPGVAVAEGGADFSAGTDLEAGLPGFLEKERQQIPVCVGAGAVPDFAICRLRGLEIVEEARNGLGFGPVDVVGFDEVVVWEAKTARKAEHQLFGDGLNGVHEFEAFGLEAGQIGIVEPFAFHVLTKLHLIGLFLICRAR